MRVLYLISIMSHGRGGHTHSLNHIADAVGEKIPVGICTVGLGRSDVLESSEYFINHIPFNGLNFGSFINNINEIMDRFEPTIIHFFDVRAYNIFTLFFNQSRFRIVVNKCGGPNPTSFPSIDNLVLFSEENREWFAAQRKFNGSNIIVVPNRINRKFLIWTNEKKLKKANGFCFMRIARIGVSYRKSIEDSVRLINLLTEDGCEGIHLYIIGVIENEKIFNSIRDKIRNLPITLLTADKYTRKASDMLYLADAVIATGRGIMEATALGKAILTPAANSQIPVLVNSSNFQGFFNSNFSERNLAPEPTLLENYNNIRGLVKEQIHLEQAENFSSYIFEKHFEVNNGVPQYIDFYKRVLLIELRPSWSFLVKNLSFKIKTLLSVIKHANFRR